MHSYLGIRVQQRQDSNISFILLAAPANEIYSWSQADDIKLDRVNVQRSLVDSRWKQVRKFFDSYHDNIVPTSITVAFADTLPEVADSQLITDDTPAYHIQDLGQDIHYRWSTSPKRHVATRLSSPSAGLLVSIFEQTRTSIPICHH